MVNFTINAKFLDCQVEFPIPNPGKYTLESLLADVYVSCCSSIPDPTESFKIEVKLPWSGQYMVVKEDRDLQHVFDIFEARRIFTIRVDISLVPLPMLAQLHTTHPEPSLASSSASSNGKKSNEIYDISSDGKDTAAAKHPFFGDMSNEEDSEEIIPSNVMKDGVNSGFEEDKDHQEEAGNAYMLSDNANAEDEDSEDEQLSNAASFNWDSDFMIGDSSEDEDGISKPIPMRKGRPFKALADGKVNLEVGQLFKDLYHFRQVLRDFVVQEGFRLQRIKNDRDRYTAMCASEGCSWRIHASPIEDKTTFMIKTLQDRHCCQKVSKNQEANAVWVASRFKILIEENPDVKVSLLEKEIHRIYGITIPSYTLYRAKYRVLEKTKLEYSKCYDKLYKYGYAVKERNPGSMAFIRTIVPDLGGPTRFQRFFLSFYAQKAGFLFGCRPFIGLDGCHLKGRHQGVLLSAIAIDANNGVFPLAICIAEGECKESWGWFLEQLYIHIGLDDCRKITFMSDRQKGVLAALEIWWPRSNTRFCVRHIIANLQKQHKGPLNGMHVWKAANCSNHKDFVEAMDELKTYNPEAYTYMMKVPLKQWAAHVFDANVKSEHTTNNITECFNGWVDKYRGNPALTLLENIRRKLMRRMNKRLEEGRKWESKVPPKVAKKMAERQDEGRFVNVFCASPDVYEVREGQNFWIVDFRTWSCDCGLWEISGIPCKHAMAVITGRRMNSNDFVHKYLTTEAYINTYSYVIYPIPDETQWPQVQHVEVLPPIEKKLPGRPKKNRKRGADEPIKKTRNSGNRCGNCGELGHNVRSCKAATAVSSSKTKGKGKKYAKTTTKKTTIELSSTSTTSALKGRNQGAQSSRGVGNIHGTHHILSSIVGGTITQPITSNASLQSSHNAPPIEISSRSNPSTVAGLDME